jgi:hypothetical protein
MDGAEYMLVSALFFAPVSEWRATLRKHFLKRLVRLAKAKAGASAPEYRAYRPYLILWALVSRLQVWREGHEGTDVSRLAIGHIMGAQRAPPFGFSLFHNPGVDMLNGSTSIPTIQNSKLRLIWTMPRAVAAS